MILARGDIIYIYKRGEDCMASGKTIKVVSSITDSCQCFFYKRDAPSLAPHKTRTPVFPLRFNRGPDAQGRKSLVLRIIWY